MDNNKPHGTSAKGKKTLTEEQKHRMKEGRQKAHEKRLLAKNALKDKIKEEKLLQQQAIQQQRDLLASQELNKEQRKIVKNKLSALKSKKQDAQPIEQSKSDDEESTYDCEDTETINSPVPEEEHGTSAEGIVITDDMYAKEFNKQVKMIEKTLPKEAKKLFKQSTEKFNFNLSLEENINSMITHVKNIVEVNTKTATVIRDKLKLEEAIKLEEELIVCKRLDDEENVRKLDNQLQSLFNLK